MEARSDNDNDHRMQSSAMPVGRSVTRERSVLSLCVLLLLLRWFAEQWISLSPAAGFGRSSEQRAGNRKSRRRRRQRRRLRRLRREKEKTEP